MIFSPPPYEIPAPSEERPPREPQFVFGVDIGQAADYTAIAVVERASRPTGRKVSGRRWDPAFGDWAVRYVDEEESVHHVRHLERMPLGTSYVDQAARVTEMVTRLEGVTPCPLVVVDQTGAGRPFCDLLWRSLTSVLRDLEGLDHKRVGVTITAGNAVSRLGKHGGVGVPKKHLITQTQIFFGSGRLKIASDLPLAPALIDELTKFKRKQKLETGHESFEHWRESDHDDLVLALCLAVWAGERYGHVPGPPKRARSYSF